jgi:hypothetical protein
MGESIERIPANLKESLGVRLPNVPMNLENYDIGLTFQFKLFKFRDSMNEDL